MTTTKNKFIASIEIKTRDIADLIVTAIEGGCGYWLDGFKPVKGRERAKVTPWYDDENVWAGDFLIKADVSDDKAYDFTPESIHQGLRWISDNRPDIIQDIIDGNGDAETADVFLQACLFGDIVYG